VTSGWVRLCHREEPKFRMTLQHRNGGCVFDKGLLAQLLVPFRRSYPERLKAAWAGEYFFHLFSTYHRRASASLSARPRRKGRAALGHSGETYLRHKARTARTIVTHAPAEGQDLREPVGKMQCARRV